MILTRQALRAHAGHLVVCGFEGTQLSPELKELLREINPLGLILFARNIESPEQVAELNREIKSTHPEPLLLCVDQEGGRVARIKAPATVWPPMARVGAAGDPALARRVGGALGRELRAMNFDVDFAPVLDVHTNPKNPIIGDRAFGSDPAHVAAMGAALIEGLQGEGVAACGKYFPGHGDTDVDSHLDLPRVPHPLARLRATEWPPFAAAIAAKVSSIMTAHVVVEELDEVPATLSPRILKEHLRTELGFAGVIVSDDIEMKAVADRYTPEALARLGLQAGVDVFLACRRPEITLGLYRGLVIAAEQEAVPHATLDTAAQRARGWRDAYARAAVPRQALKDLLQSGEHAALVRDIVARSGTS